MEKDNINFDPENGQQFNNAFNGQAPDFKALFDNKIHWKLAILFTLFLFAYTYFQLPVYNFIYDTSIVFMMIVVTIYAALLIKNKKFVTILIPFFIFVYLGLSIYSSPIVNSGKYYDLIGEIKTTDYNTSPPKIDNSKLPVVDEGLARKLGDKVLGKEIGLGSQFTIGEYYFITTDKDIAWVAPLEPRSFFKWLQNQDGAPGYIYVSATNPNDVRLVKEVDGKPIKIKYTNNAYFMSNIHRYTYFNGNMTNGLTDYSFEIDNTGKPYWVITTFKPQVGFSGYDTTGVVIVDAQTGEVKKYSTEDELPKWVERVHPTRFLQQQINYWGAYKNGWFNTLFGQKEMIKTTPGHSYIFADGMPYFYSGLTSITNDEATVGFMLVNLRTKEATFYPITGATETAGKSSAEGQVQQFGYRASDPILVNEFGAATYFMTLKDVDGLLKQYAFVSVENYNIVGVGNSISEARNNYYSALKSNGILSKGEQVSNKVTGKVERINFVDGNYYIKLSGKKALYSVPKNVSSKLALTQVGDTVTINYGNAVDGYLEVTEFINKTLK